MPKYSDTFLARRRSRLHRLLPMTNTAGAEAEGPILSEVSGNIVDDADAALDGVTVVLEGTDFEDESAAVTGAFSFANVPSGTYTLLATKDDYTDYTTTVVVAGKAKVVPEFIMNSVYDVSGTVLDSDDAAVEGATINVWLDAEKTEAYYDTVTEADGTYVFSAINGTYYVEAVLTGYTADEDPLEVVVADADSTDNDFVLTSNYWTLTGNIEDSESDPMEGVQVNLYVASDLNTIIETLETDASGDFIFVVPNNETYHLIPLFAGYTFAPTYLTAIAVADAGAFGNDFVGTADD